ncbi:tRNA-specific 2-thiouridylase mnmA [Candidatus Moduliflexus flocculans]|uniref:tRNA-uridine 2-sulfurtransferase n=1 Tax=Candidatus Moduliflexus flocculans TaxID=1499966 RepID=A0A0S6VX83_9BACT|nr:tRNA-specific 2-thiouridylase mnmA [Candidatus Moduliflexus flocculans]
MKIAVGMSGGVDSSVAAWLLKEAGHDVFGVSMALWDRSSVLTAAPQRHACYGPDEAQELDTARHVCEQLDMPFYVFDCAKQYQEIMLAYFQEEYQAGRTPNPCVRCNQLVKFGLLPLMIELANMPFDAFATGHYARVTQDAATGRFLLRKGKDGKKDQSYFLYRLSQQQLARSRFPLAQYRKEDVRAIARRAGLGAVADIAESQDFYSGDYRDLLCLPECPGNIVDTNGHVIGMHQGVWHYTIGQRKGLGIAAAEPLYAIGLDVNANTVII